MKRRLKDRKVRLAKVITYLIGIPKQSQGWENREELIFKVIIPGNIIEQIEI